MLYHSISTTQYWLTSMTFQIVPMTRAIQLETVIKLIEVHAGQRGIELVFAENDLPLSLIEKLNLLIPYKMVRGIFGSASRLLEDPLLGVSTSSHASLVDFGIWAGYATSASTLGDAINRISATILLYQNCGQHIVVPSGSNVIWRNLQPMYSDTETTSFADFTIMSMIGLIRHYLGKDWMPEWIELGYPRGARDVLPEHLGVRAIHNAHGHGVAIKLSDLLRKGPEKPFNRFVTHAQLCRELAPKHHSQLISAVMDVILLRLLEEEPNVDIDGAARMLSRGTRSLQTDLAREGVTYGSLLNKVRLERARSLLSESDMRISSISLDLGYDSQANFSRAFQKWSGQSPRAFRKNCRQLTRSPSAPLGRW
jgi:AraC-like DNA-binding protein